jgi:outer membrane protein OmpU
MRPHAAGNINGVGKTAERTEQNRPEDEGHPISVPVSVAIANLGNLEMKKVLLGTTALLGVGTIAGAAQASDGIKLDVGGFFQTVYQGVFDKKSDGHFGNHRNTDRLLHNAEVHFKGETTLDNGLTVGAQIELEGENSGDQIDKSFVYWSGGFGRVSIGSQDGPIAACPVFPPGATANFSGFSPASWGSNDPVASNSVCSDTVSNSQSIKYTTPNFAGFQLILAYQPSANAEDYTQAGVNSSGTPTTPDGTAHHNFAAYVTYSYAGDGWGVDFGGGGSWQGKFNNTEGGNDGHSADYQTALTVTFGGFAVGGIMEYYDNGGDDNNAWIAGGGASYGVDAWTVGIQGSHGTYDGLGLGAASDPGGSRTLNRVIITGSYELSPGVLLDAEVGYTWFHDHGSFSAANNNDPTYDAADLAIGSKFTF